MSTVLIIGSTSAMAESFARLHANKKANILLIARNEEKLKIQKSDLEVRGAKGVQIFPLDFMNFDSHKTLMDSIFSSNKVDSVLVAQGNMFEQKEAETDIDLAKSMIDINLTSVVSLCNAMIPHFEKQKSGSLAVISSVAGDRGRGSNFIYACAKAGVQAYLSGLRARLFSFGVNVLDIRPGFVSSPMTAHLKQGPLFAKPEVVAIGIEKAIRCGKAVVYLPFFWCYIMFIIRNLPNFVFVRLKF